MYPGLTHLTSFPVVMFVLLFPHSHRWRGGRSEKADFPSATQLIGEGARVWTHGFLLTPQSMDSSCQLEFWIETVNVWKREMENWALFWAGFLFVQSIALLRHTTNHKQRDSRGWCVQSVLMPSGGGESLWIRGQSFFQRFQARLLVSGLRLAHWFAPGDLTARKVPTARLLGLEVIRLPLRKFQWNPGYFPPNRTSPQTWDTTEEICFDSFRIFFGAFVFKSWFKSNECLIKHFWTPWRKPLSK